MKKEKIVEDKARCAFLIAELAPGGAEKALFHLVSNLDRERFDPVVYSLSGRPKDMERSIAPQFRELGIETIELGLKSVKDIPRVLWRLRSEFKRRRPCLLQTFMFHANIIGRFAARISNVPLVCSGVRVAERDSPLRLAIDRLTGSLVDAWVAVGESTAEFTRKVGRIPSERVFSIPNGAQIRKIGDELRIVASGDLTSNAQARESFATRSGANRKKLVAVGRLTRQKGFDLLLESAATWLDSERAKEWELWIVGDGEESDALREQRDRLGLKDSVFLLGWRADVARILADSEIFLLSSRWEGMPNALLEAAALGKPALCSNVEGVSEILGENAEPQTYVLGDLEEEVKKINALLDDEALRRDLGQKNRERVLKEFTVEKTAERYEELWLKLLRKKGVTFKFDNEAAECESDPKKR